MPAPSTELLAPAGGPDAGYAALHYGADAVYLGLNRFSARAEAENFTPAQLDGFTAYAHHLGRRVYLTLNTLVKQNEIAGAADTLAIATDCGVDAVIIQDMGVAAFAAAHFPDLPRHASTQMAIHNLEGARAAADLGFSRVTLARELTFAEIEDIVRNGGLEVETFIHGTLCYSYSGLCLFSSIQCGRSGNRGRCIYTCRESAETPRGGAHPFSLKDMALGPRVLDLAKMGVASLKIEGRKKSPLYVAATVDYYRGLLDGRLGPEDARQAEASLKTIFARPWTRLFIDSRHNPDAADPEVVGHRGLPIGAVESLTRTPAGPGIVFTPSAPVERHDGLQIDLPGVARPFGFGVDNLYIRKGKKWQSTFAAPAGEEAAVALPGDTPALTPGLPLYQSSSQAVKRSFPFDRPKPAAYRNRIGIALRVEMNGSGDNRASVSVSVEGKGLAYQYATTETASPARDAAGAEQTARGAFERLGDSPFRLDGWRFGNPDSLFLPPKTWNTIRRAVTAEMEQQVISQREDKRSRLRERAIACCPAPFVQNGGNGEEWGLAVDDIAQVTGLREDDFARLSEVSVTLSGDGAFPERLENLSNKAGREKIRLALPLIARPPQSGRWNDAATALLEAGWRKWLVPNLGGWRRLADAGADITADWSLYSLNCQAMAQWRRLGFSAVTLSPEDDADNLAPLLAAEPSAWVIAYASLPLFVSAACARTHLNLCSGRGKSDAARPSCGKPQPLSIRLERSGEAEILPLPWGCGTTVVAKEYFSLLPSLPALRRLGARRFRLDLRWKHHDPQTVATLCQSIGQGVALPGRGGNFGRSLI